MTPTKSEIEAMRERLLAWPDRPNKTLTTSVAHMMQEAAAMLAALAEEREWMPIEAAPRDGTKFLIWCPKSKLSLMRFNSPIESETWSITGRSWIVPEPTHWRPLPTPPEQEQ